ncbi:MAG: family 78 glycoside hydrolase catalytic domain [Bacteroidales bacterium]|nr:family 78 glycoside hydrolase catalytic domain [Bacteroidales bacterium]
MRKATVYIRVIFLFLFFGHTNWLNGTPISVANLRCEYLVNPLGIDAPNPRLSWKIVSEEQNLEQTAYEIQIAFSTEELKHAKPEWQSGKVMSSQSVNVVYTGPELQSMQRIYWQVRVWDNKNRSSEWSEPAFFETGILHPNLWNAEWITVKDEINGNGKWPPQYYRKKFELKKKIQSARIYVTSLGLYQLFLNGEKVGDQYFTPGWTSYHKRLQYQTYDITDKLNDKNAFGVILADGWFRGKIGYILPHSYYGNQLGLLLQLHIDYTDGSEETITTDTSWKFNGGPILQSNIYNGETYDARLEMKNWCQPDFDDSRWKNSALLDYPKDKLIASMGLPVKKIQEINPVKIIYTPKGEKVLDMGQNMVGWLRFKVRGKEGDTIKIRFAEVLDKEGNFYTENLRSALATNTYILNKDSVQNYEPYFTFFGFRYVRLEGISNPVNIHDFTGIEVHSDMEPTGYFSCSDSLINQLQHNILWGQKDNFLDIPTDCPQRDERLGWTGDAQVFSVTAAFNFDVAAFYTKWAKDIAADQLPNGKVTDVVPDVLKGDGGSTAWADVAIVIPWTVYRVYGDKQILEEQYSSMKAWVDYMTTRAGNDYLWTEDNHYGDHLAFGSNRNDYKGATTEKDLIATAYFYYSTTILSQVAKILDKKEDYGKYEQLAPKIKKAFDEEFITTNGRLVSHTQTAYALALSFGLVPDNLIQKSATYLANDVIKFGHLTTGFVGTPLLCSTLSGIGRDDLAFMLLTRKEYPSWLYPITMGATTIWERWDGIKPDGTFQDPIMNSFNHYAYGAIGEWLYSYVAGILVDENNPGYKHFYLQPHVGGGLTYVNSGFESMYGKIESNWKLNQNRMIYSCTIPPNSSATVCFENMNISEVSVTDSSGKPQPIASSNEKGKLEIELGSGKYILNIPLKINLNN